ncbi:MAG: DUF456 domain-containing protein [Bacteroidales bacterium]|nr:DUF456 domain-containing protein [Bacteroidales bacterium]
MADWLLAILGIVFILAGIAGCILPVIPGPPLSWAGLLLLHWTRFAQFSAAFLIVMACLAIAVTVLDYIIPVWGTKKFGGSKAGMWGATIGIFAGIFFFPPVGIIVGPFIGAVLGEIIAGKESGPALKAGLGSFIGFLLSTGLKLGVSLTMAYYFFRELIL